MAMQCPVCRSEISETVRFCSQCGARLVEEEDEEVNLAVLELIAQYERLVRDRPADANARFNLALTYLQARRWGAAVQQLELVRQMEPDFPDGWYWLAVAQHRLGDRDSAQATLQEFLRRFPDHPKAISLRQRRKRY